MKTLLRILLVWLAAVGLAWAAVDINTASEAELDGLPGIGPAKARAIVEDRRKNGPFRSVEDLKRVKGIGDKVYAGLRSEIRVGAVSAPAAARVTSGPPLTPSPPSTAGVKPSAPPTALASRPPAPAGMKPAGVPASAPANANPPRPVEPPKPAGPSAPVAVAKPAGAPPRPAGMTPPAKPVPAEAKGKVKEKAKKHTEPVAAGK